MFFWERKWLFQWARTVDPQRDTIPLTALVWRHLAIEPDMQVADVGAGLGYFTFKIAERLGPGGHVVATEASPRTYLRLRAIAAQQGDGRVCVRWSFPWRIRLEPDRFDRILMLNVFPFIEGNVRRNRAMLREVARALRPGGRFVLVADAVHTTAWNPPYGTRLWRNQSRPDEIIEQAAGLLRMVQREEVVGGPPEVGKELGYVLVFEKCTR